MSFMHRNIIACITREAHSFMSFLQVNRQFIPSRKSLYFFMFTQLNILFTHWSCSIKYFVPTLVIQVFWSVLLYNNWLGTNSKYIRYQLISLCLNNTSDIFSVAIIYYVILTLVERGGGGWRGEYNYSPGGIRHIAYPARLSFPVFLMQTSHVSH